MAQKKMKPKNFRFNPQVYQDFDSLRTVLNKGKEPKEQISETQLLENAMNFYVESFKRLAKKKTDEKKSD